MRVITVKIPDKLVEIIDRYVALHGYSSRSELIRTAVIKEVQKDIPIPKILLNGLIRDEKALHDG